MRTNRKKASLSNEDRKLLIEQTKPGIVLPIIIIVIGLIILLCYVLSGQNDFSVMTKAAFIVTYIFLLLLVSAILGFLISKKFIIDLKNGVKYIEKKQVKRKEIIKSHEAGSGTLYIGQEMKEVDVFAIIIDNTRYKVEKDLFDKCRENGFVEFHYGAYSNHLIKIEPILLQSGYYSM